VEAAFREGSCSNHKLDRDDDSKKSHPDLGLPMVEKPQFDHKNHKNRRLDAVSPGRREAYSPKSGLAATLNERFDPGQATGVLPMGLQP
jgi:hypothetical protein